MPSTKHFAITPHVISAQHIRGYYRSTANETDELKIAVKQYTPLTNRNPKDGDITLIAAHANGVNKELYEPLWDDLYETLRGVGVGIRGIWIADVAWQGESGVLNERLIGDDRRLCPVDLLGWFSFDHRQQLTHCLASWYDHPRDLLHMVNHFRAQIKPPLFGLGHSMGANHIVNLSLLHPRLFAGVILVDSITQPKSPWSHLPAFLSAFRRDTWPSRKDAADSLTKNPFYQAWDPRVLKIHIEHAFRDLPTLLYPEYPLATSGQSKEQALLSAAATSAAPVPTESPNSKPVTLTTTKHQEVFTFIRSKFPPDQKPSREAVLDYKASSRHFPDIPDGYADEPIYRPEVTTTFLNLPLLRPHALFVFPTGSTVFNDDVRQQLVDQTGTGYGGSGGAAKGAVQRVAVKGGHFAPFENPALVANDIGSWLSEQFQRWRAETAEDRRLWEADQKRDGGRGRMTMSPEYLEWLKWVRRQGPKL